MNLSELLALVDAFHITDKRLLRARANVRRAPTEDSEREFRKQALRYFGGLQHEAEAHLADVDRRLDDVYQRQYNLHAERAVAQRRLESARTIAQGLREEQP